LTHGRTDAQAIPQVALAQAADAGANASAGTGNEDGVPPQQRRPGEHRAFSPQVTLAALRRTWAVVTASA